MLKENKKKDMRLYPYPLIKYVSGKIHLDPDCSSWYAVSSPPDLIDNVIRASLSATYTSDQELKVITWDIIVAATAVNE